MAVAMASLATHYPISLESYLGTESDHHAIFVRINDSNENCGHLFHVNGSMQQGMFLKIDYNCHDPTTSLSHLGSQAVGWVPHAKLDQVKEVCETIPPPAKQWNGGQRLVPADQVRSCQEWVAEVLEMLKQKGIMESPDASQRSEG
jgi:hypothetical protein